MPSMRTMLDMKSLKTSEPTGGRVPAGAVVAVVASGAVVVAAVVAAAVPPEVAPAAAGVPPGNMGGNDPKPMLTKKNVRTTPIILFLNQS